MSPAQLLKLSYHVTYGTSIVAHVTSPLLEQEEPQTASDVMSTLPQSSTSTPVEGDQASPVAHVPIGARTASLPSRSTRSTALPTAATTCLLSR